MVVENSKGRFEKESDLDARVSAASSLVLSLVVVLGQPDSDQTKLEQSARDLQKRRKEKSGEDEMRCCGPRRDRYQACPASPKMSRRPRRVRLRSKQPPSSW